MRRRNKREYRFVSVVCFVLAIVFMTSSLLKSINIHSFSMEVEEYIGLYLSAFMQGYGRACAIMVCVMEMTATNAAFAPADDHAHRSVGDLPSLNLSRKSRMFSPAYCIEHIKRVSVLNGKAIDDHPPTLFRDMVFEHRAIDPC